MTGIWGIYRFHGYVGGHVFQPRHSQGKAREQGYPSYARQVGFLDLGDRPVQDVGQNLAPQVGTGAPADEADGLKTPACELLHVAQQPAQVEGHAFQHGPGHFGPSDA